MKLPLQQHLPLYTLGETDPTVLGPPDAPLARRAKSENPMSETRTRASHTFGRPAHRWTTFAATPHEVSALPEGPESGRKSCVPLYSAITASAVFLPGKAKTEKKKIFVILGDVFSVRAFVRLLCNGAPNCRPQSPSCAARGPFPATSRQISSDFRNLGRGLKLYALSRILPPPFRQGSSG